MSDERNPGTPLVSCLLLAAGLHVGVMASLATQGDALPVQRSSVIPLTVELSGTLQVVPFEPASNGRSVDFSEPQTAPSLGQAVEPSRKSALSATTNAPITPTVNATESSSAGIDESAGILEGTPSESGAAGQGADGGGGPRGGPGNGSSSLDGPPLDASREARLSPSSARCSDLFPFRAPVDRGAAMVHVMVDADGHTQQVRLGNISPRAHGFEIAARVCAARLEFEPARNRLGERVASSAQVQLIFERND